MPARPERVTRVELAILSVITAAGLYLRLDGLGIPSMWLDEMLSYDVATHAARQPWWRWIISTFEPEHGPLFHGALLAGRFLPSVETSVRVMAAVFGTAAIPFVWRAARTAAGEVAGLVTATLLAISPLGVYYSRDGRPYSMLMLLAAALIAAMLDRRRPLVIVVLLIACAYTSATSAPLLVSVALCSSTVAVVWRDSLDRPIAIRNAVGAIGALLLMALLYRTHGPHPAVNVEPQFDFSAILQAFSVAALQPSEPSRLAYLVFGFAIAGAATCAYRNRRHAVILTGMAVFPAALAWLALAWFHHWFEIRYLSAALPAYLILAGIGITEAGRALARLTSNVRTARAVEIAVAFAIAVPIAAKALPAARTEPYRKLNWRLIASTVWQHAAPGDIVVAASDWSAISLGFYLEQLPPRVRMINAREHTSTVEALVRENQPVWIVSAGYYRTNVLPGWFCRYHPLLASPLESFGLHYSPGRSHFLRSRALPGEWRAVSAPFRHGFSLSFSGDDDTFLGDGWAGRERIGGDDVRWVMGSAASVILPLDTTEAHRVRIRMMPFEARGLPPQRLRVYADAALIVEQTMSPGWRDYEVPWPARASRLLRLELSRANAPAEHDRSSSDRRQLSALVTEITVDASAAIPVGPFAFSVRLQELDRDGTAQVLDDVTATHETQFSPRTWRRDALVALAGRSGFDPDFAVPRLIAGTMTIEDLAESLLDRSGCLDDVAFVRNAYWSIIGRSVTEDDARRIVKPWTTAKARRRLIQGLIESSEFRQRMTERTRDAE